jgi:hypothetical protein
MESLIIVHSWHCFSFAFGFASLGMACTPLLALPFRHSPLGEIGLASREVDLLVSLLWHRILLLAPLLD